MPSDQERRELAQRTVDEARSRWGTSSFCGLMVLESARRTSTVLVGTASLTSTAAQSALAAIDWRTAPLAEVYFGLSEGESWEGPGGLMRLVTKLGFTVDREGQVQELFAPGRELKERIPRRANATPFRSPLDVTLDAVQQRVVDLPAGRHALVLGEAGFGKTTVALRRLEALAHRAGPDFRAAVLVPSEGLRRLTSHVLERRGLEHLEVFTWDSWARQEAQRAFKLPQRESVNASSRSITLKRHLALSPVIEAYAKRRAKGPTTRKDLLHLFGDTAWLEQVVAASAKSEAPLHPASVKELAEHTHVQFLRTSEKEWAHVTDSSRLTAIDGSRLDEGTPDEDAGSIDVEDYAVLFALEAARARRAGHAPRALARWDALVVDEGQEFAPLELELMSRALRPRGTLIVAGDAAQQVDETTTFGTWAQVMTSLGVSDFDRTVLEVNYRCPADVTAYARQILSGDTAYLPGPHLEILERPSEPQVVADLIEVLRGFIGADSSASVAVICRSAEIARRLAATLAHGLTVQLALNGDFRFRPGLIVTSVLEVKGLEFDVVVVHDAQGQAWTSTPEARRALYVAVTRATNHLLLTSPSPAAPASARGARR